MAILGEPVVGRTLRSPEAGNSRDKHLRNHCESAKSYQLPVQNLHIYVHGQKNRARFLHQFSPKYYFMGTPLKPVLIGTLTRWEHNLITLKVYNWQSQRRSTVSAHCR